MFIEVILFKEYLSDFGVSGPSKSENNARLVFENQRSIQHKFDGKGDVQVLFVYNRNMNGNTHLSYRSDPELSLFQFL